MTEECACPPEAGAATCVATATLPSVSCPACQGAGKPVDTLTLKALLAISLTEVRASDYRFCRTPDCSVVYYSVDSQQRFGEDALRERVFQKHPSADDVFVCYCFRHTPRTIKAELATTGRSTVVADITAGIQAGQCACDVRNPQGSCCLGNVRAVLAEPEGYRRWRAEPAT